MFFNYIRITKKFDLVLKDSIQKKNSIKVLFSFFFVEKNKPILKKVFGFRLILILIFIF